MSRLPATTADHRPQLDGIRALAVVAVVLFHLGLPWIPGGFIGVDVFFVLSGYLITGLLVGEAARRGTVRLGAFYARRARRLLPAAAVVLLATTVGAAHLLDEVGKQQVGLDVTWAALYGANWRFASADLGYFTPGDVPSPVTHFWSLAVEEQFYLVWPVAVLGLWRLSTRRRGAEATGGLLAAIAVAAGASAWLSVASVPDTAAYYSTFVRAHQLLAGAALAVAVRRWGARVPDVRPTRAAGLVVATGSLGVLTALALSIDDATAYPGWQGIWVTLASMGLLVGLDVLPGAVPRRVVGCAPLAAVGRLSYSLYLWHWPVIVFAPLLAARWERPVLEERWVQVGAMVALAVASYLVVERPVRFSLRPAAPGPVVIGVGLVTSVLVAVVGIPFLQPRDPFAVRAIAAVEDNAAPGPCPYFREQWGPPSRSEPCVYREGGDLTVAVVGDSHAQQWQPAFDVLAERHDLTVVRITRRGCPANDLTVQSYDDQGIVRTDVPCTLWRDRVYPATIERFDPDVVFVETRSHEWAFRIGERHVTTDDDDHLDLWARAWDPTLEVLTAGTGTVVVSHTLPDLPWRVPACLAEHGEGTTACDVPLAADGSLGPYNDAIADLPSRHDDVVVVDPTAIVCPDGTCPAVIDGEIVHRDDDHITASFARASADDLEALLIEAGVALPVG